MCEVRGMHKHLQQSDFQVEFCCVMWDSRVGRVDIGQPDKLCWCF